MVADWVPGLCDWGIIHYLQVGGNLLAYLLTYEWLVHYLIHFGLLEGESVPYEAQFESNRDCCLFSTASFRNVCLLKLKEGILAQIMISIKKYSYVSISLKVITYLFGLQS